MWIFLFSIPTTSTKYYKVFAVDKSSFLLAYSKGFVIPSFSFDGNRFAYGPTSLFPVISNAPI
jgi:hypothetical protein